MDAIEVEYLFTREEAERARQALAGRMLFWLRLLPVLIAVAAFVALALMLDLKEDWIFFVLVAAILPFSFWRASVKTRRMREEAFEKSPNANKTIRWIIRDDAIEVLTDVSTVTLAWPAFTRVREHDAGFLLYVQPRLAHWLPKAGFPGAAELDRFRECVGRHGLTLEPK